MGASSGGYMAAKLLAEQIVSAALVMVMGIPKKVLDQMLQFNTIKDDKNGPSSIDTKSLYLAPMVKDVGTAKRVRENYKFLIDHLQQQQQSNQSENHLRMQVTLDETSCQPLPLTVDYLWNRVPGMTKEAAQIIIDTLIDGQHIDSISKFLIIDPTQSKWRDLFLNANKNSEIPNSLLQQRQQQQQQQHYASKSDSKMLLWETFDLTPGISPLAKALHRAWAFHEYCSEAVNLAMDLFER
jgi:hypothetical protein